MNKAARVFRGGTLVATRNTKFSNKKHWKLRYKFYYWTFQILKLKAYLRQVNRNVVPAALRPSSHLIKIPPAMVRSTRVCHGPFFMVLHISYVLWMD